VPWACGKRWRADWVRTEGLHPRFAEGSGEGVGDAGAGLSRGGGDGDAENLMRFETAGSC
jgi:hypothetical protein